MTIRAWSSALCATLCAGLLAAPASAGHHQWDIVEIFSNADGTIQYIELLGLSDNEQNLLNWTITIDGEATVFTFNANLPTNLTNGTRVLVATAGFTGVTPDYVMPDNFIPIGGGTMRYAGAADVVTYPALPTDGIHSVDDAGTQQVGSPTNFAGESGSIGIPTLPQVAIVLLIGAVLAATLVLIRRRTAEIA